MPTDYSQSLSKDSYNLTDLIEDNPALAAMFREREIDEAMAAIDRRQSVLLTGQTRSGKSAIINSIALALSDSGRQILQLSSTSVMVGTRYLGDWQSKMGSYVDSARAQDAILNFVDIGNLAFVGQSASDSTSVLDLLRPQIVNGEVVLIGEATPDVYKQMQRVNEFTDLFHTIRVAPLNTEQIDKIVEFRASHLLQQAMDVTCHQHLKQLADNFAPPDIGPGTRLQLLERIKNYQIEKDAVTEAVTTSFIDKVFSIYSGLPVFVFSQQKTVSAGEIRRWFRSRIFGQEQAIEAVVECITLFKSGLRDPNQPIGTFLFTGPTGVGKTELSKALAEYLYGSSQRLLRFDMSEYASYDSYQTLIGQSGHENSSALLVDPVCEQPFQVILFDEIEKGHQNVFDLLLQLLDEGRMTQPNGRTVDFRNTMVICTTNAGASEMNRPTPGFTREGSASVPMHILERHFRPEFLNRFQHVLVFHALNQAQVRQIAKGEVKKILKRSGIVSRNLIVDINDNVIDTIVEHGYSDRYGARALKREVQRRLALPVAAFLMENSTPAGSLLTVSNSDGRTLVKGFPSKEPAKSTQSATLTSQPATSRSISGLKEILNDQAMQLEKIEQAVDVTALRQQLSTIDKTRDETNFWNNRDAALQNLKQAESINDKLNRLERLRNRVEELLQSIDHAPSRTQLARTDNATPAMQSELDRCDLELITFSEHHDRAAILLLQPISDNCLGRDELYELYYRWSRDTGRDWTLLHEPQTDTDPAMISIGGNFTYGYLVTEAGLHRHRSASINSATRVTTAPEIAADENATRPSLGRQQALKQYGRYGGKIRSIVEIEHAELVLKNDLSIVENRELAASLVASWQYAKTTADIVRRYDAVPFFVKDYASNISSGRRDILRHSAFTELLASRARLLLPQASQTAQD